MPEHRHGAGSQAACRPHQGRIEPDQARLDRYEHVWGGEDAVSERDAHPGSCQVEADQELIVRECENDHRSNHRRHKDAENDGLAGESGAMEGSRRCRRHQAGKTDHHRRHSQGDQNSTGPGGVAEQVVERPQRYPAGRKLEQLARRERHGYDDQRRQHQVHKYRSADQRQQCPVEWQPPAKSSCRRPWWRRGPDPRLRAIQTGPPGGAIDTRSPARRPPQ